MAETMDSSQPEEDNVDRNTGNIDENARDVAKNRYSGYSLFRVNPLSNMSAVDKLLEIREKLEDERTRKIVMFDDIIVPVRRPVKFIVSADERPSVEQHLDAADIKYTVVVDDIARRLDEFDALNNRQRKRYTEITELRPEPMAPNYFMTYDEIEAILKKWAESSPDFVSIISLGLTAMKRDTIGISVNANKDDLPAVWVDGGIDPRVWMSTASVLHVAFKIIYGTDDDSTKLRANYRWYFVPTVNPDGYQHSMTQDRFWRKTRTPYENGCYGTDMNRNFNVSWGGAGTTSNPCRDRYRGPEAFSEVETLNLKAAIERCNRTAGGLFIYISFQGHGQYILAPWTGRDRLKPADYDSLWVVAKEAIAAVESVERVGSADEKFRFGTPPDIRYPTCGSVVDWVRDQLAVNWSFAIDVCPSEDSSVHPVGFNLPATAVYAAGQQAHVIVGRIVRAVSAGPVVDQLELYGVKHTGGQLERQQPTVARHGEDETEVDGNRNERDEL